MISAIDSQKLIHFLVVPVPNSADAQPETIGNDVQILRHMAGIPPPFVTFSQMKDHCFIMPKADCIRQVLEANALNPVSKYEVRETSTVLTMVQEGIGYTILPELALPENLPKVRAISLKPKVTRKIGLAVRNFQSVPPAAAEFLVHAQEYVKKFAVGKS